MARRMLFMPSNKNRGYVKELEVSVDWVSHITGGKNATMLNVAALHQECSELCNIGSESFLEVSGASQLDIGKKLSAMNLGIKDKEHTGYYRKNKECAESLYQGSKIFENGGPHHEIYTYTGLAAKKKISTISQEKRLGKIIGFNFKGIDYESEPKDAFYNWLYMSTLCHESNRSLMDAILKDSNFFGFTDIFFNHERQKACQARALAIFVGMAEANYSIKEVTDFAEHVRIRE